MNTLPLRQMLNVALGREPAPDRPPERVVVAPFGRELTQRELTRALCGTVQIAAVFASRLPPAALAELHDEIERIYVDAALTAYDLEG